MESVSSSESTCSMRIARAAIRPVCDAEEADRRVQLATLLFSFQRNRHGEIDARQGNPGAERRTWYWNLLVPSGDLADWTHWYIIGLGTSP